MKNRILFLIGKGKAGNEIMKKFRDYDIHVFTTQNLNLENLELARDQISNYIIKNQIYPDLLIFNVKSTIKNTPDVNNIDLINLQNSLNSGASSLISIIHALNKTRYLFENKETLILVAGGSFAHKPEITQFNLSLTKVLLSNIVKLLKQMNINHIKIKILEINGKIGNQINEISPEIIADGFKNIVICSKKNQN